MNDFTNDNMNTENTAANDSHGAGFSGNENNATNLGNTSGGASSFSTSPNGAQSSQGSAYGGFGSFSNQSFGTSPAASTHKTYDASGMGNQSYTGYNTAQNTQPPQHKKKKKNAGKTVFAILVCICIVIASIGVGTALSSKGNSTPVTDGSSQNTNTATGGAATPGVEQSPVSASEYSGSGSMTAEQVYAAVKDINVGVVVYSNNQKSGEGSGIIVGADATDTYTYILTAAHVISGNYSVQIQFSDDTEIDAEIVGFDTKTDVGVLRVKKTGFKAATFGDSSKLAVGQTVYAIGNPGGSQFFGTFTDGKVTSIDRPVSTSSSSAYDLPCIQHNAAINPGNSGGALVNEYGQVIGLNSSKIAATDYEGMGFSVPINTVLTIYNDIVSHGYVTDRPMLGITYYAVSSDYTYSAIAWRNNLPYGSIVIKTINKNSDLANKNVQVGDIVTAVNGTKLDSTDTLLEAIEKSNVGDTLTLSICRLNNNGSVNTTFDVKVTLVEDKGDNTVQEETEQATDNFNSYFPFGY